MKIKELNDKKMTALPCNNSMWRKDQEEPCVSEWLSVWADERSGSRLCLIPWQVSSVQHERCNDFLTVNSLVSQKLSHAWLRGRQRPDNKTLSTFPFLSLEISFSWITHSLFLFGILVSFLSFGLYHSCISSFYSSVALFFLSVHHFLFPRGLPLCLPLALAWER